MKFKNNLTKASLVGILAVVFTVTPFERLFFQALGMSFDEFGGGMPTLYLIPLFLIYTATAMVFARMKENLDVSKRGAFYIILAFHFFITALLPELEGKIYLPDFPFFPVLVSASILALGVVSSIFYLWKQENNPKANVGRQIKAYFSSRSMVSWGWRFPLVWILFYVLTMVIGIVAYPFTKQYLDDPMNTLGMVIPSLGTLFAITQFRSFVYILVTLPFIIFWKSGKKDLFVNLALINVISYPLLGDGLAYFWPVMYRLVDGIVLVFQVTVMSWLYVTLLGHGKKA
ncbi:hypothetical protein ACFL1P_01565 [Patescibacteria group bacterium]